MDCMTPEQRSLAMSHIRSRDTAPEEYIRKHLYQRGFRYRKNDKRLPGCPDLWLSRYRTAIFIHGCYWHRHKGCKLSYTPKSRVDFWQKKFDANVSRDIAVTEQLHKMNIRILIIWECAIRKAKKSPIAEEFLLHQIEYFLLGSESIKEIPLKVQESFN